MSKVDYKDYIELMEIVYPNHTKAMKRAGSAGNVWVDSERSWNRLDPFLQKRTMDGLQRMLDIGMRDFDDKKNDNRKIRKP